MGEGEGGGVGSERDALVRCYSDGGMEGTLVDVDLLNRKHAHHRHGHVIACVPIT